MSPTEDIRRLIKSRLRLHILQALEAEQPQEGWRSVVEVEKGIAEDAWKAWVQARASFTVDEIDRAIPDALKEAVSSTEEGFRAIPDGAWLKRQVEAFVKDFHLTQLLVEAD